MNTPCFEILLDQIEEVLQNYDADGIFLDIMAVRRCYCPACLASMKVQGLDPENVKDVDAMAEQIYANYCCRPLFGEYADHGSLIAKLLLHRTIDALIGDTKTIVTDLPVQGVTTVMEQPAENRLVHHLLYASPVRRGQGVEIIEDVLPVYNVHVTLRTGKEPKRVYLASAEEDLPFTYAAGAVSYTLPKLYIHQMIVLEF